MEREEQSTIAPLWRAQVLTLFPDMFPGPLGQSLPGKALAEGLWALGVTNLRDFGLGRYKMVDDTPVGGGAGMVMRPDVVAKALDCVADKPGPLIYLSPRGKVLNQDLARGLANGPGVRLLCGRYEGVDQRVLDHYGVQEISIGDYVLSGGELAAMVLMDSVVRLLPGVLGNRDSMAEESFEEGLLEYPLYTRPAVWEERPVPSVLLSGHHAEIRRWRKQAQEEVTKARRPDLWDLYTRKKAGIP